MTTALIPTPDPASRRGRRRGLLLVLVVLAVVGTVTVVLQRDPPPPTGDAGAATAAPVASVEISGIGHGETISADELVTASVRVRIDAPTDATTSVTLDGAPVGVVDGVARLTGDELGALGDGQHTLLATARLGEDTVRRSIVFVLDTTPPSLSLPAVIETSSRRDPLVVPVEVDAGAEVLAEGGETSTADDGTVRVSFPHPPAEVVVTATDAAGNATTASRPVVTRFPGGRAVHVTPSAWRYAPKREPIIAMLEAGLIDAVQMDVKDELGDVAWDTDVELADLAGAEEFNRNFDMAAAIETIHAHGARVIGRLVVYRDHRLAQWAWEQGRTDLVVQGTDGQPYAGRYGEYAFTNFAHPEVQQYNLDIALEAVELGFDDILYDYIRRPDGAMDELVVPGLGDRSPEEAVVEVMATAYPLLRERGAWVGASVFGIAIDRPTQMAQDIPMMAEHVDYIAPMVYPNHWNPGEYDVPVPEDAPYDIVQRSLSLYQEVLEPTGTALMPWLQDFGGYGEAEVRAQIDATESVTGQRSFLLWASSAEYTAAALDPIAPAASDGT